MLWTAVILFLVAAFFGLMILSAILKNNPTPKSKVFIHGPVAAIALILVIMSMFKGNLWDPMLMTSVVLFILAALGGLTMFTIDMRNKPIPKLIALVHPLVAIVALVLLVMYLLK